MKIRIVQRCQVNRSYESNISDSNGDAVIAMTLVQRSAAARIAIVRSELVRAMKLNETGLAPKLGLIYSTERLNAPEEYDLLAPLVNVKEKYPERYSNVEIKAVAWDAPANWEQFTHIILSSGIDYQQTPEEFLNWLESLPDEVASKVYNPPSVIRWNINKFYLQELQQKGIDLPPSVFIRPNEEITIKEVKRKLEAQSKKNVECVVLKSLIGAGGINVEKIALNDLQYAEETLQRCIESYEGGVLVQDYLSAIETDGEWSVLFIDSKLSHAQKKIPSAGGFRVQTLHGGSSTPVSLTEVPQPVLDFSKKVFESIKVKELLYCRIDVVYDGSPYLMEVEAFEPDLFLSNEQLAVNFLEAVLRH